MNNILRKYAIFFLSLILVGGFFLSYVAYTLTGGEPYGEAGFSGSMVAALAVVGLTYFSAYRFFKWAMR